MVVEVVEVVEVAEAPPPPAPTPIQVVEPVQETIEVEVEDAPPQPPAIEIPPVNEGSVQDSAPQQSEEAIHHPQVEYMALSQIPDAEVPALVSVPVIAPP